MRAGKNLPRPDGHFSSGEDGRQEQIENIHAIPARSALSAAEQPLRPPSLSRVSIAPIGKIRKQSFVYPRYSHCGSATVARPVRLPAPAAVNRHDDEPAGRATGECPLTLRQRPNRRAAIKRRYGPNPDMGYLMP